MITGDTNDVAFSIAIRRQTNKTDNEYMYYNQSRRHHHHHHHHRRRRRRRVSPVPDTASSSSLHLQILATTSFIHPSASTVCRETREL
jgi:uncharacterized membrane protein YgaE (UPF0421/DUF939 family)